MSQGTPRKEYLERIKKEEIAEGIQRTLSEDKTIKINNEEEREK